MNNEKEKQMAQRLQNASFNHPYVEELAKYIIGNGFVVQSMCKSDDTFTIDCKRATLYVQTYKDVQGAIMRIANKKIKWGKDAEIGYLSPVEYWQAYTNRTPFVRITEKQYEEFRP